MTADLEEQEDELLALQSIYGSEEFVRDESKFAGEIRVNVELPADFSVTIEEGDTVEKYDISSLPPLLLTFDLPEDYPSSSPPSFTLTCSWLNHTQIVALSGQLTDLYQATGGTVVLFSWIQFLKEDILGFLDIRNVLELPSDGHSVLQDKQHAPSSESKNKSESIDGQHGDVADPCEPASVELQQNPSATDESSTDSQEASADQNNLTSHHSQSTVNSGPNADSQKNLSSETLVQNQTAHAADAEAVPGLSLTPSQMLLSQILIHDAVQKQKVFDTTVFDCSVCFMSWLGSECVQLPECGHIFCQTCLREFCKIQITEGSVRDLTCPQADCKATPTPAQVRMLVGEELFGRYDRLLLQSTLDRMSDVTYCPRSSCGSAVIQEKSSTAAMCSVCGFAFCVACKKTYHGTDDCQERRIMKDAAQSLIDLPKSQEGIRALWEDYASGSKQRKRLLEKRYGRSVMVNTVEYSLSVNWISVNAKHCPYCFTKIEKNGGCNMMTCSQCGQLFCWVCLTKLQGRNMSHHFSQFGCNSYY